MESVPGHREGEKATDLCRALAFCGYSGVGVYLGYSSSVATASTRPCVPKCWQILCDMALGRSSRLGLWLAGGQWPGGCTQRLVTLQREGQPGVVRAAAGLAPEQPGAVGRVDESWHWFQLQRQSRTGLSLAWWGGSLGHRLSAGSHSSGLGCS